MLVLARQLTIAGRTFPALTPATEVGEHSPSHGRAWAEEALRYRLVLDLEESEIEARRAEATGSSDPGDEAGGGDLEETDAGDGDDGDEGSPVDESEAEAAGRGATAGAVALAESHGIDVESITGSGLGGRVTKADVEQAVADRGGGGRR